MRALVTGGAGFIGHHLVRGLLDRGDEVSVIDDLSTGAALGSTPFRDRIDVRRGRASSTRRPSTRRRRAASRLPRGGDPVGGPVARDAARDERGQRQRHDRGDARGGAHGVRRVVLRGVVVGLRHARDAALPRDASGRIPQSPYGASKLAAEHYVHTLGKLHGIETVVLRYFNVFGPGQDPASEYAAVVPRFIDAVLEGRQPMINGDGADLARLHLRRQRGRRPTSWRPTGPTPSGLTCNVACGDRYSLLELLTAICGGGGRPASIRSSGRRGRATSVHSQADISVRQGALGYEVGVPFEEGVARTVAWYRDQVTQPAGSS